MNEDLQRWQADCACRDTVARAALHLDHGELEAFAGCFTEDAQLQRPGGAPLQGRAAILAAYQSRPAARLTRHLLAAPVVDLLAPDRARCRTPVQLWAGDRADAEGPQGRPQRGPVLVGRFDDLLARGADGRWRIAARRACFELHLPGA